MSDSVLDLVEKLAKAGRNVSAAQSKSVEAASLYAKKVMVDAANAVNTPTKLTPSGAKAAWGARYQMFAGDPANAVVYLYGAQPYWRERGIGKHFIVSKYITGGRSARGLRAARNLIGAQRLLRKGESSNDSRAVLHWGGPDGGYSTRVLSPGVKARPFWDPVPVLIASHSEAVYHAAMIEAMVEAGFG